MPPPLAIAEGGPLSLANDASGGLSRRIAARVAACPAGLIRSLGNDGVRRQISYRAAWARSARIAAALPDRLAEDCPPIVIMVGNAVDVVPAVWACLRAGHVFVALPSALEAARQPKDALALRHLLQKLGQPILLIDEHVQRSPVFGELARDYATLPLAAANETSAVWDDAAECPPPLCLVATSGSTGSLKLAMLEERALLHRYFASGDPGPRPDANTLGLFPVDSITGLRMAFLQCETFTHVPQQILATRPDAILTAMDALRISYVVMTNATALRLLDAAPSIACELDFSALKLCGLGGETIGRELATRLGALFARFGASAVVKAGYGATETGPMVLGAAPSEGPAAAELSVPLGACAPGVSMRIVGEDGAVLQEGAVGAVEVHAPLKMFSGYWGEAHLTRAAFTPDGWWKTGDLGRLDGGVFTFRGRSKQILVVQGRKLSLTEMDAHLQAHPEIGVPSYACAIRLADDATDRLAVAFLAGDEAHRDRIAEAIRSAMVRRFGIRPDPVLAIPRHRLPLTSVGKIRRADLAALITAEWRRDAARSGRASEIATTPGRREIEAVVEESWRDVLNLDTAFDRAKTFFELGGDSLRSAALYACIEARLDRHLPMDAFFAEPTYANLLRLVAQAECGGREDGDGVAWPLPAGFRRRQLAFVESWAGRRMTPDRLVCGLNVDGALPPLVCVLQSGDEFTSLAGELGPAQPVYAFRSAFRIATYTEDIVQSIALRYVHDIEHMGWTGPLFLLGQCQGATIAIAMAQHLLRRGRHLPLLVLVEWTVEPAQYPGPTLLLYGHDSIANPMRFHYEPASAWRRMFPDHAFVEVPGAYARLYAEENVGALAQELRVRFAAALSQAPRILPKGAPRIAIEVGIVPERLAPRQPIDLDVLVRNVGDIVVSSRTSGLLLGNYWTREEDTVGHRLDARITMPDLAPGATFGMSLAVRAPAEPGRYRLCLDLVEEGHRWLNAIDQGAFHTEIAVEEAAPPAHAG